jgi:hypothetical protein
MPVVQLSASEQIELGERAAGGVGIVMNEGVPSQLLGGFNVFGAVIEEEDLGGWNPGGLFEHAVEGGIGFHGPMFEREDVMREAAEEGVVGADVSNGQVVGIGEDGGGAVGGLDAFEQVDHGHDGREDIAETGGELFEGSAQAGFLDEGLVKLRVGHFAALVFEEKRGVEQEFDDLLGAEVGVVAEVSGGDAVVEVDEHFTEIKDDEAEVGG